MRFKAIFCKNAKWQILTLVHLLRALSLGSALTWSFQPCTRHTYIPPRTTGRGESTVVNRAEAAHLTLFRLKKYPFVREHSLWMVHQSGRKLQQIKPAHALQWLKVRKKQRRGGGGAGGSGHKTRVKRKLVGRKILWLFFFANLEKSFLLQRRRSGKICPLARIKVHIALNVSFRVAVWEH